MNNYIALSIQPGTTYFNFNVALTKKLMEQWDGVIHQNSNSLLFSCNDLQLYVADSGQIKAFSEFEISDPWSLALQLIQFTIPKAVKILGLAEEDPFVTNLNIHWPSGLTTDQQLEIEKEGSKRLIELFGHYLKVSTVSISEGRFCTSIAATLGANMNHNLYSEYVS